MIHDANPEDQQYRPWLVWLTIAGPLSIAVVSESVFQIVFSNWLTGYPRLLLFFPFLCFFPVATVLVWRTMRLGLAGLYANLSGMGLMLIAVTRFRGAAFWPGTFETSTPFWYTVLPVVVALATGIVLSRSKRPNTPLWTVAGATIGLGTSALVLTFYGLGSGVMPDSLIPYTRHIVTIAVIIGASIVATISKWIEA